MISPKLIQAIRAQYQLDWHGVHGSSHWARVRSIGLKLSEKTGANKTVVELFAFLHDSRRFGEHKDPFHGERAVDFAKTLRGSIIHLTDAEFDLLSYACLHHTSGYVVGDMTVLTCWDADRLDLGRVGTMPLADKLCTKAAKDPKMIAWAYTRSEVWANTNEARNA